MALHLSLLGYTAHLTTIIKYLITLSKLQITV